VNAFAPASSRAVFRRIMMALVALLVLAGFAAPAGATTIERVVSPGGIVAWLVHEPAVPMIAVDIAFAGGAVQDPPGKAGTASFVASLLDEGAGDLDSKAFADRLESKAIEMSFSAERDSVRGSLRTLTANRDEAFDLLRLAFTALRRIRCRTQPRAAAVDPAAADDKPGRYCERALVADGVRGPPLWPAGQRYAGDIAGRHRRRSQDLCA
jgi:predicted Zn-dependent peptidase